MTDLGHAQLPLLHSQRSQELQEAEKLRVTFDVTQGLSEGRWPAALSVSPGKRWCESFQETVLTLVSLRHYSLPLNGRTELLRDSSDII